MIHRLVVEHLRENSPQAFLNALGISFEVMTMLVLAETKYIPGSHPIPAMIVLRITAALIVWVASSVAFLFVVINRYSQVRERTRQFAILKMFGASSTVIFELLFHETMLIAVPGTVAGIVLAYGAMGLFSFAFPDLFVLQTAYEWWLLAGIISAAGFLFAGSLAAWIASKQDLIQALSSEE
jgi:ABC-type antimicrobial peptide transport system permease subunit